MKAKKYWILAGLIVGISTYVCGAYITSDVASLRGLSGVGVKIRSYSPEMLQKYDLPGLLQTDTELQLRQFGIRVLSEEEQSLVSWNPLLVVVASIVADDNTKIAAVSVKVEFHQNVLLQRDINIVHHGVTWERSQTGLCSTDEVKGLVQDMIKVSLNKFINDYLAVNLKEHSTDEKAPWRIEAKVGQDFVIYLPSNPSTGYSWRLVEPLDEMVKLEGHKYIPPKVQKLGGGGTEEWTFKAARSGKATVKLEYLRFSDESSISERRTFTVLAK